ncbi:protein kinase [Lentisphaera profundi]|uniref:Protein kinase n=1 Tax=Lentisphaera profundi TaxID=1658616 RepID=A0ABY7VYH5_9BACT|nr:serine/threonine-protein kinase [Lentisphaera profundi]WDE99318.1 protein kinase [Lentisphaera profundi]
MEKRKEENYDNKFAHFCDEISSFEETPLINNIESDQERYKNFSFLDEGGAKLIYRCQDNYTGREVAMAKLKDKSNEFNKERFLREAQLTSLLQHPNIVPVYDLGLKEHQPWFTMKLVSGQSLKDILHESEKKGNSPLDDLNKNLDYFLKICDAIAYAHSRAVLHLDLKPANIQISDYGDLVVCDWGLANILPHDCDENMLQYYSFNPFDEQSVTVDGLIKGTPGYMAPEQTSTKKAKKCAQTDIFSLGAILYSMLCFQQAFKGASLNEVIANTQQGNYQLPSEVIAHVPKALEAICQKAMSVDIEDRYQSVLELQDEVFKYRNGFATSAENASLLTLFKLWIYRHKMISSLAGLIFLILLIGSFVYLEKVNLEKENALQLVTIVKQENEFVRKMGRDAAPRFLERAQWAYSSFNIDDAVNFCDSSVELNPELTEAWQLKAELHFIKEEFKQALEALVHTDQQHGLVKICQEFSEIKSNDLAGLKTSNRLNLIKKIRLLKLNALSIRYIHHKANTPMELDDRIDFAYHTTLIMNNLKSMNFNYDKETQHLDLSKNKELKTALAFQNFPAKSTDLSNTAMSDFTSITNQKIRSLDISSTNILSLRSLSSPFNTLRHLNLSNTAIRSLLPIKNSLIESIDISWTDINALSHLDSFPNLKQVTVHLGQFKKGQIKQLKSLCSVIIKQKK